MRQLLYFAAIAASSAQCENYVCDSNFKVQKFTGCSFGCEALDRCTDNLGADFDSNGQLSRCKRATTNQGVAFSIDCGEVATGTPTQSAYINYFDDFNCTLPRSSQRKFCDYPDGGICESLVESAGSCNETGFGGAPLNSCTACCDRSVCDAIRDLTCLDGACDLHFGEVCAVGSCRAYFDTYTKGNSASTKCDILPWPAIIGASAGGLALIAVIAVVIVVYRKRSEARRKNWLERMEQREGKPIPVIGSGVKRDAKAKATITGRGWAAGPAM